MNRNNKWLIILVIILGLLVVGLSSYIVYDKVLKNDTKEETNSNKDDAEPNGDVENNSSSSNEDILTEIEAKVILKDLDEKYYPYHTSLGPFCGEFNRDDYISFGESGIQDFRDYWASKTFKTISELKEYLSNIMVNDSIPKYIDDGVSYIEKDGKLYCLLAHKGGGIMRNYDVDAEYKIQKLTESEISADVVFCGQDMGEMECSDKNLTLTIIKDSNKKWLVSNYKIIYN